MTTYTLPRAGIDTWVLYGVESTFGTAAAHAASTGRFARVYLVFARTGDRACRVSQYSAAFDTPSRAGRGGNGGDARRSRPAGIRRRLRSVPGREPSAANDAGANFGERSRPARGHCREVGRPRAQAAARAVARARAAPGGQRLREALRRVGDALDSHSSRRFADRRPRLPLCRPL